MSKFNVWYINNDDPKWKRSIYILDITFDPSKKWGYFGFTYYWDEDRLELSSSFSNPKDWQNLNLLPPPIEKNQLSKNMIKMVFNYREQ